MPLIGKLPLQHRYRLAARLWHQSASSSKNPPVLSHRRVAAVSHPPLQQAPGCAGNLHQSSRPRDAKYHHQGDCRASTSHETPLHGRRGPSQIDKLVGLTAPAEFVAELEELANTHHEKAFLDVIRAYHFGVRYIVELEVRHCA